MWLVQRLLFLSVFICVTGGHWVWPERVHCVLLPELRLQSGSRVYRRIHFPFNALKRPEWNIRWRTLPQTHGRTRLTSHQHVGTLTWPLVLQESNLYSVFFFLIFQSRFIFVLRHTSLVLKRENKSDYSIHIFDLKQFICWLLTFLFLLFLHLNNIHHLLCTFPYVNLRYRYVIQYGYGGVWI